MTGKAGRSTIKKSSLRMLERSFVHLESNPWPGDPMTLRKCVSSDIVSNLHERCCRIWPAATVILTRQDLRETEIPERDHLRKYIPAFTSRPEGQAEADILFTDEYCLLNCSSSASAAEFQVKPSSFDCHR
jgi:hypothetical protein